jgi:hypothetical protein
MALLRCRPQMRRWIRLRWLVQIHEPGWRNWQTQRTQNPSEAIPWGFDSPSRHHLSSLVSLVYEETTQNFSDTSGAKLGTVRILRIFNRLMISGTYSSPAIYI